VKFTLLGFGSATSKARLDHPADSHYTATDFLMKRIAKGTLSELRPSRNGFQVAVQEDPAVKAHRRVNVKIGAYLVRLLTGL
jgi:hypothetical protein